MSGWGFYLTPDKDFTYRWAGNNAFVNEYEFDEKESCDKNRESRKNLHFIRAEKIEKPDETNLRKEQDSFQSEFARTLEMIMGE